MNIVLTAVMMFSLVGADRKTATLVDAVSTALSLHTSSEEGSEAAAANIPMTDIEIYNIADKMTIPLKDSADGSVHYAVVGVSFSINNKNDGYKTYGSDLSAQESLIKSEINAVFGQYSMEEAKVSQEEIKKEILAKVQGMYQSDFIFNVSFSEIVFQ